MAGGLHGGGRAWQGGVHGGGACVLGGECIFVDDIFSEASVSCNIQSICCFICPKTRKRDWLKKVRLKRVCLKRFQLKRVRSKRDRLK